MKLSRSIYTALLVLFIIAMAVGCGRSENSSDKSGADQAPVNPPEQAQITQQKEYIETGIAAAEMAELSQGDTLNITNTFRDQHYTLKIRSVRETLPSIVSISANIQDRETGLATLNLRNNVLTGTLVFYKDSLRFSVAYDSAASQHYLTELPYKNPDELEGSAPMEPPKN